MGGCDVLLQVKGKKRRRRRKDDPNSSVLSDATANEIPSLTAVAPRDAEERRSSLLLPGHLRGVPRSGPVETKGGATSQSSLKRQTLIFLLETTLRSPYSI